jgi:hypothetical protein
MMRPVDHQSLFILQYRKFIYRNNANCFIKNFLIHGSMENIVKKLAAELILHARVDESQIEINAY